VVFGPTGRKYTKRVNKKMRKAALRSALADKANAGRVWVLDSFDEPRTKAAAQCLKTAGIEGRALVVLDPDDDGAVTVDRAFRNLGNVAFALHGAVGTYDVLVADDVIFTQSAFDKFTSARTEEVSS
jgi:large subunit ribosomal protein L4